MDVSLVADLGKVKLKNPIVIGSGILARGLLINALRDGAAAVTTKTITLNPR
ncbi:MAG: dihydroorotate dehydrogenase, partial [Thermoprotei archaeon]